MKLGISAVIIGDMCQVSSVNSSLLYRDLHST